MTLPRPGTEAQAGVICRVNFRLVFFKKEGNELMELMELFYLFPRIMFSAIKRKATDDTRVLMSPAAIAGNSVNGDRRSTTIAP